MTAVGNPSATAWPPIPELGFSVQRAAAARPSAVPAVRFALHIEAASGQAISSILLDVQIQIAARQRRYSGREEDLLEELFGVPERWGTTLRTLPWARITIIVPPFETSIDTELLVPCSYDLEVAGARYLSALADGTVPLEFLFSGSVFFRTAEGALQTTRIASDSEASFQLPVAVWRETMDRHFPGSAWLRLGREQFQALCAYKARHTFTSWEAAIDALLGEEKSRGR